MKPLVFLDVDGVFNRFSLQHVIVGDYLRHTIDDFPGFSGPLSLVLDPADTGRVATLAGVGEPVWATPGTTWQTSA